MPEPRTLQPVQFFKDLGEARGQNRVQDFRPRVVKGDPLGDYPTTDEAESSVVVVTDDPNDPNDPARPLVDEADVPEPDTTAEEDPDMPPGLAEGIAQAERGELLDLGSFAKYADEDQGSVDDLLTRTDDQESIAAHGTPDGG